MIKKLSKDIAVYGFSDFIFKIISFAIFPVYTHYFSVEEFGIINLVSTVAGLLAVFLSLGMNSALHRFYFDTELKPENRAVLVSSAFWTLTCWSAALTALILVFTYFIESYLYNTYSIPWVLLLYAFLAAIPQVLIQLSLDTIRLHFTPWKYTFLAAFNGLFTILLILFFVVILKQGITGYFSGQLVALTAVIPVCYLFLQKELKPFIDIGWIKKMIKYGYPLIFTGLAYWIFSFMDRWMLATFSNNTQVGLFSVAAKFATILLFMNAAFGQAWSPYVMKIYSEQPDYRTIFSRVLTYWFLILSITGIGLSVFGTELLMLTTPEPYWGASGVIGIIVIGLAFFGTTQITALGISITKNTQIFVVISWLVAALNFILNWLLAPEYGALGSAVATLVSYIVLTILYYWRSQKLHPLPYEYYKIFSIAFLLLLSLSVSFIFNTFDWNWLLVFYKIIFCGIIVFILFLLKILNTKEIISTFKSSFKTAK